ncbi:PREDICTED: uncharacterized protein LOC107094428 isoform X2 [Cyprinodon variegatus]|uniref:uncharacterized protein LOC107094428 isoform X2 n=1 Tax=Cyprinodon variegatus TaxID=28743 RepID=UPI0007428D0C|nr:PREDICTED: uncharacterized protein LOC107094428 isoform X2 [Cyprinodon variegatus]
MTTIFAFFCLLKVTLALAAEINIEGIEGGDVSFKCSHKLANNNKKYFCKDPCNSKDILVTVSPGEKAESGRINLVDHEDGSFKVTIKHLQVSDSHVYWCAVIRSMRNTFTSVNLTVHKVLKTTVPPTVSSPWFPDSTTSTQMTNSVGTTTTRNISNEINSTGSVNRLSSNLGPMLGAGAVTAATLIIFILAACIRKRREMSKPQLQVCSNHKDPGSKVTEIKCCGKGGKSEKHSSEGIAVTIDHLRPTSTPGHFPPIYENLSNSTGASGTRHLPVDQQNIEDINERIYITPLPFAASETTDRKDRINPTRRETGNHINTVSESIPSEPPSRSLWFGLDVNQINLGP